MSFKVLLIYPNTPLLNPPPVSIALISSLLKENGIEVEVFDTTFYLEDTRLSSDKAKEENLQVRPFAYSEDQIPQMDNPPEVDLQNMIDDFNPNLIGISVLEGTWALGSRLLSVCEKYPIPVIVGGVFATFAPEIVFDHPAVDMICVGEGEHAVLELCLKMKQNQDIIGINNIWIKDADGVKKKPVRPVLDLNDSPFPDYSVFHPSRFLRPMAGRIYKTIPFETNRGCPFGCTFCNSPSTIELYRDAKAGHFFRKKSMERIEEELDFLIKTWDAEYVYFLSDTFLSMSDTEFEAFIQIYNKYRLPFWIQTRAETITQYRADKLKEVGCHRMSIGLEHGNAEFRKKILNKKFSNKQMIKATECIANAQIPLTVNNIIGFPDETRELVFDTIELNRKIKCDTTNAYVFAPFHGTPLHEYSVEKGYIKQAETIQGCVTLETPLEMPHFPKTEIAGIRRVFALYAKMSRTYWNDIERAEQNDNEGNRIFAKLSKIYQDKYFT